MVPITLDQEAAPATRQALTLLIVATSQHLSSPGLRGVLQFLESHDYGFELNLQIADPAKRPELLELYRLVATPAVVKLHPAPRQVFAGNTILEQLKGWLPRWQQLEMVEAAWE